MSIRCTGITMLRYLVVTMVVALACPAVSIGAHDEAKEPAPTAAAPLGLFDRETLTDNWFGLGERLGDSGIEVTLGLTSIYQMNTRGGLATHRHAGRWTGSYDLELSVDLEKLLALRGLSAYMAVEGSWSDGLNDSSVGALMGVNGDAGGDRSIDVTQLWFEQSLFDGRAAVRVGKVNLTGGFECRGCPASFDGNMFANDETGQFLNGALVNNPQIPFPDNGLGVIVHAELHDMWYVSAACADAQADVRETGFATAFGDEDYFFAVAETGIMPQWNSANGPLQGGYRLGLWYDPQPKGRLDGGRNERDDLGLYISADQAVYREGADDDQGLGVFLRMGWADSDLNQVKSFWSVGAQYRGLVAGRDADVLALGFAQSRVSASDAALTERHETIMEIYYNAEIAPWLSVTPSVQYIWNPGANGTDNACVVGVRFQIAF